jgi:hypothetical protein
LSNKKEDLHLPGNKVSFCDCPEKENGRFCDVPPTVEARQTKALEDIASSLGMLTLIMNKLYTEMMGESPFLDEEDEPDGA